MIKRVTIRNYRSIETLEFHPTALCALVGENNAGKSNILRALKTVLGKDWLNVRDFLTDDVHRHEISRDVVIEIEFDPPLEYEGFAAEGITPVPILRYTLTRYKKATKTARKGDPRLLQECISGTGGPVSVLQEAPRKGATRKYKPLTNVPSGVKAQLPVIYIGADRRLADQVPSARYSLLRRLLEDVAEAARDRVVGEGEDAIPLNEHFEHLLQEALSALRIEEFVELESLVASHALENLGYDSIHDKERFTLRFGLFEPAGFFKAMRLVVDEHGVAVDAQDLGDGAQNAIIVAIFQAYEKMKKAGAVFLVEEPELHLHPHRSRYFYETLRRISSTNQVIYTTHSPHFVTVPYFDEVRLVFRNDAGATEIIEPKVDVTPQIREKLIKELDPERNELFFARYVILVEGDTEKLALPEYARRLGLDLNRHGVSVVEVGGKKSVELFARVIKALGLSTTIVFDEDSSDFSKNEKDKEAEYNAALNARADERTRVLMLRSDYEDELRRFLGEDAYHAACQAYPKVTKAVRARLIARDETIPIPDFIKDILAGVKPAA